MTKRLILGVALAVTASCSLEIKQLQRPYDPRTQPRCEPEDAAPVGDVLAGAAFILLGLAVAAFAPNREGESTTSRVVEGIGVAAGGALWGGIGIAGFGWNKECYAAREQWDERQIEQDEHLRTRSRKPTSTFALNPKNDPAKASSYWCSSNACVADEVSCRGECTEAKQVWCVLDEKNVFRCAIDRDTCLRQKQRLRVRDRECVKQTAALDARPVDRTPTAPTGGPRGFFCTGSPSNAEVGSCARRKATCENTRGVLAAAVVDLMACTLVESAWCVGDRCAPTEAGCVAQIKAAGIEDDCSETF